MSFQAMTEVRSVKGISSTARLVLFTLAQYAGADGVCHPSQATVAEDAGLSERSVRGAIAELRAAGVLETDRRCRRNGSRTSDQITLKYFTPREAKDDEARVVRKRQDVPVVNEADNRQTAPDANRQISSTLPAPFAGPTTFESVRESTECLTNVSHSARARARAERLWAGKAPERVSPQRVAAAWSAALTRSGLSGDRLLAAVAAAVRRDPDFGRGKAMNLDRWLAEDRFLPWLPAGDGPSDVEPWTGPAAVRIAVVEAMGQAGAVAYLDPAGWDEAGQVVRARTSIARDRLAAGAGPTLRRLGVGIACAARPGAMTSKTGSSR
jgi:hypothetical protein